MPGLKSKTIKNLIRNKLDNWINSIEDDALKSYVKLNCFVTGGAIVSMLLDEKPNDYDVYFKTQEAAYFVAEYYVNKFNELNPGKEAVIKFEDRINIKGETENRIIIYIQSNGVAEETPDSETLKLKYRPKFLSENAITLSDKMQLIVRFYGSPEEVHKNYDFIHTTNYYDYSKHKLSLNCEALESILTKTLIYRGSLYPVASVLRIRKFIERGWRITAGQVMKMLFQLNSVDLKDRSILREQLIGVDQAYMTAFLNALENIPENADEQYLAVVIDKIFE